MSAICALLWECVAVLGPGIEREMSPLKLTRSTEQEGFLVWLAMTLDSPVDTERTSALQFQQDTIGDVGDLNHLLDVVDADDVRAAED